MATKLKKMKLTSVDLVRAGANQEADICLFKSADPPEAAESPTEKETNIFKRFIHWLRENPTEAEYEPQNHIEKADDQPDLEYIYKSALAESLYSIMTDDTLTEIEKKEMTEESLRQYNDKVRELEDFDEDYDGGDDIDEKLLEQIDNFDKDDDTIEEEIIEETDDWDDDDWDDDDRYEMLEEVDMRKFNQNHGRDGRFTSSGGGGGGGKIVYSLGGGSSKPSARSKLNPYEGMTFSKPKERGDLDQWDRFRGGGSTGTSPASAAMRRFTENATGTVHTYNSDGKLVSSKPGGRAPSGDGGKYNTPYHKQARSLAATAGSKKLSGEISAKKVSAAIERGGTVKDFAGKSYMISPQTKGTITCYTGSRGKNGSFKPEKYIQGIKTLQDAQMWGVGTILNDAN